MRFAKFHNLELDQAQLDFVDIDIRRDKRLFLDPYAIGIKNDDISYKCGEHIRSFFQEVLDALGSSHDDHAVHLMSHLHEPQDTFLGLSKGKPQGRGVGPEQALQILAALKRSRAVRTGVLHDLGEAELFLPGIGPDKVSDMTTNVLRNILIEYTKDQCDLHGIKTMPVPNARPLWNASRLQWESTGYELPFVRSQPVLLIPKFLVRARLSLDSQEFYNHHLTTFLQAEYLNSAPSLVHVFRKSGRRTVFKKTVQERNPFSKDFLADFVRDHPKVLETYKKLQGAKGPLEHSEIEKGFDERQFAAAIQSELRKLPAGKTTANKYETFMKGLLSFLFYPDLASPIKGHRVNDGRKIIDITFSNVAQDGFFMRLLKLPQTRSATVMFECKNYNEDPKNPEIDQLLGRFDPRRGFFGILLCRQISGRGLMTQRCKDAAQSERGYVVALDDSDLEKLLKLVEGGRRDLVGSYLADRFSLLQN